MQYDGWVLDRTENPHPVMLAGALRARDEAVDRLRNIRGRSYWEGYLAAMCDATGETPEAIEAWMDRNA